MIEERTQALLCEATILSARKIIEAMDSFKPNPGKRIFRRKSYLRGSFNSGKDRPAVAGGGASEQEVDADDCGQLEEKYDD